MTEPVPAPARWQSPHGCRLQLMQADQLADYKTLRDQMLAGHEDAFTSDAATELAREASSYRSRLSQGSSGGTLFTLLAWLGTQLVGAVTVEREPRSKVHHNAHLIGMMVLDRMQGRGIGSGLLDGALQLLAADPGIELLTLSVTRSNTAAVRLYASRGFQRYGCLERAIKLPDGRYLDKDLMCLDLRGRPHTQATR